VWSAWSAWWTALDYDFDWFVIEYEYCNNRKDNPGNEPNKNDLQYLEYCELLMRAKEYGLGYRAEHEDTLYLVPTPIIRIDEKNRFHSLTEPAIRWKGGSEFYFLWGVSLKKELWEKTVNKTISAKEVLAIDNTEQRMVVMKVFGLDNLLGELKAKLLDKSERGNELYLVENIFSQPAYYLKYKCPSTGRVFIKGVNPKVGKQNNADLAQANSFELSLEEYNCLKVET
jgi:hypothetical protein